MPDALAGFAFFLGGAEQAEATRQPKTRSAVPFAPKGAWACPFVARDASHSESDSSAA